MLAGNIAGCNDRLYARDRELQPATCRRIVHGRSFAFRNGGHSRNRQRCRGIENNQRIRERRFSPFNLDSDYTQNIGADIDVAARLSGQFTDQPLVSSEQFAAGGLTFRARLPAI